MRTDISNSILEKTALKNQNTANNANPKLSLIIARKETILDDIDFTERRRAVKTTKDTVKDVAIAVSHPKRGGEDESAWIAYVRSGKLHVRWSKLSTEASDIDWNTWNLDDITAAKCDIVFDSLSYAKMGGGIEYVTRGYPWVFYLYNGAIKYIDLNTDEETTLVESGASMLSARQTPDGVGLFYVKSGTIYYKLHSSLGWGSETTAVVYSSGTIRDFSTYYKRDGFGLQVSSGGHLYVCECDSSFNWGSWEYVEDTDKTGAVVDYFDGKREAFFDKGKFCYSIYDQYLGWSSAVKLYEPSYSVIEHDHTNEGTVYFTMIMERTNNDVVYFFRYVYMKDASAYTQNVDQLLQVDNPITQINATLKNIDDSLYTSDASLFAPSSVMKLGVSYGDSSLVNLGTAYIDEASIQRGGPTVSLSGRNKTGVYLNDQSFGDDVELTDTPSLIVEAIMTKFGLEDDYDCDLSADGTFESPNIITMQVTAKMTGLDALETLGKLLSDDRLNKHWKFEETCDGYIVVGYDEFRSEYIPKNYYTFNGRSDVFVQNVDKCIDGVYSKVRCTGTTKKGKEIAYTANVKNFRFWDVGDSRIYHADPIEGIEKDELKKYAKALAQQLKQAGRVITYRMSLRPQILIGDVANITDGTDEDEEPKQLGYITEINHHLGAGGYFTDFTLTSGGQITPEGSTPATRSTPASEKAYVGYKPQSTGRKRRIMDFIQGGEGDVTNIKATVINNGDVNFPEVIRNIGLRLLDEPTDVEITYDATNNAVKLKWTDPSDISSFAPVPCAWERTVVVRNQNGNPLNIWDGLIVKTSTTRDEHKTTWLVDDTNIQKGQTYYYGIFPAHLALDDQDHPIYHYRYTKVVSIVAGQDLEPAIITDISVSGVDVTLTFTIPALENGSYSSITLVAKKDGVPLEPDDGDEFVTLDDSDTTVTVTGLDEESHYYFVIFTEDNQGNTASSDSPDIMTGIDEGWNYDYTGEIQEFTAPKTGVYSLETWGAQGGNATDGTLTARGGYGAYSKGEVLLTQGDKLYIGVGGQDGYNGGGSNLSIHNLETWQYRGNTVDMTLLTDFSQIPEAVKTATSHTSSRIYNQSASSRPNWLTMGDVLYEFTKNTSETGSYIFVDSDYIKIQFGEYQEDGNTYYGFAMFNKITGDRIDSYGDALTNNTVRDYYLGIVIDTPNQRAYLIIGNSKSNANYFRVDVHAFMYNGVDLLWETFKYC